MLDINEFTKEVHQNAKDHGWWDEERSFGDIIALCHSELSEALEEYRKGNEDLCFECTHATCKSCFGFDAAGNIDSCMDSCHCKHAKPEGIAVELADCIIRILDYCGKEGIDIEAILKLKHEYNKTRPYKHGGKKI